MAVSDRKQLLFWGIGLAVFALFLWLVAGTLVPFLAGAAIAYFLDPVADRLERLGLSRVVATSFISIVTVLVFVLILLLAVPALIAQVQALVEAAPGYIEQAQALLAARFPDLFDDGSALRRSLGSAQQAIQDGGIAALNAVLIASLSVFDFALILVFTPVVAFYLLLDWDAVVAKINNWLPRQHAPTIRRLAGEIDVVLAGFVRGQLSVCLILGGFYALALMAIGLRTASWWGWRPGWWRSSPTSAPCSAGRYRSGSRWLRSGKRRSGSSSPSASSPSASSSRATSWRRTWSASRSGCTRSG